ncbi:hypothetical protein EVAR_33891_1 [Eumeta japonica]|uniref:Uncharacterized protein n=1 Tax=Eumeta variegata TaxID=151549 RepID=A0A4C1WJX0_EUMVA|nr:hypothetical protein EVAR_33891_1 [Eumeta japonica]
MPTHKTRLWPYTAGRVRTQIVSAVFARGATAGKLAKTAVLYPFIVIVTAFIVIAGPPLKALFRSPYARHVRGCILMQTLESGALIAEAPKQHRAYQRDKSAGEPSERWSPLPWTLVTHSIGALPAS